MGEQVQGGILHGGVHSSPLTWVLPWAAACPGVLPTPGLTAPAAFFNCPVSFLA